MRSSRSLPTACSCSNHCPIPVRDWHGLTLPGRNSVKLGEPAIAIRDFLRTDASWLFHRMMNETESLSSECLTLRVASLLASLTVEMRGLLRGRLIANESRIEQSMP